MIQTFVAAFFQKQLHITLNALYSLSLIKCVDSNLASIIKAFIVHSQWEPDFELLSD